MPCTALVLLAKRCSLSATTLIVSDTCLLSVDLFQTPLDLIAKLMPCEGNYRAFRGFFWVWGADIYTGSQLYITNYSQEVNNKDLKASGLLQVVLVDSLSCTTVAEVVIKCSSGGAGESLKSKQ